MEGGMLNCSPKYTHSGMFITFFKMMGGCESFQSTRITAVTQPHKLLVEIK